MNDKTLKFYQAMIAYYPDLVSTGQCKRQHIVIASKASGIPIPGEVWKNKLGRGLFKVELPSAPVEDTELAEGVVNVSGAGSAVILKQARTFVPGNDSDFVPFGSFFDVESIITSEMFYPTYITGLSGNGKSTMVEQICARQGREMIRVNLNALSDEEQLIGSKTLTDGNVEIVEGPVLVAMRSGAILLVDEIDAGSPNSLLCLQAILEGKPYFFKLKNEIIYPALGFNIIATGNTKGKGSETGQFIGTNILNEAFLERFGVTFEQEYPSESIERRIILNVMTTMGCKNTAFAKSLAKWSNAIRKTYNAGGCDEIMSTRRIVHIVKAFSIYKDEHKSVDLCCRRFDKQTSQAFMEMFKAIQPDPIPEPTADDLAAAKLKAQEDAALKESKKIEPPRTSNSNSKADVDKAVSDAASYLETVGYNTPELKGVLEQVYGEKFMEKISNEPK